GSGSAGPPGSGTGTPPASPPASPIVRFGIAGPMTGPNAVYGAQLRMGAEQARNDINAAGGILGHAINAIIGDDVSDPKQGVTVANDLAAKEVGFVVGHFNSGVTIPTSEIYQEKGILQVTPAST